MSRRGVASHFIRAALFEEGAVALSDLLAANAVDWAEVVHIAGHHLVTPVLRVSLCRRELETLLPDDARHYLETVYRLNVERNSAILRQLDEVIDALNQAGISPMLLKGAAYLKLGIHSDAGSRLLSDIDLLIPREHLARARSVLEGLRYRVAAPYRKAKPQHHHLPPMVRDGCRAAVELHGDVMDRWARQILPTELVWQTRLEKNAGSFSVPSGTCAILHRFLHDQIGNRYDSQWIIAFRSILDLIELESYYRRDIDWEYLTARTQRFGYAQPFRNYVYLAHRIAGMESVDPMRFGWRQRLHLELCKATARSAALARFMELRDEFSPFLLMQRYGEQQSAGRVRLAAHYARRLFHRFGVGPP